MLSHGPAKLLDTLECAVLHGAGMARISSLPALLAGIRLVRPGQARAAGAQAVLAWGRKPSAQRAEAWARARGLPVLWLEDGFLRSVGLGVDEPPLSVVLDDEGIYYDARSPSRLERLIREAAAGAGGAADRQERAECLRRQWCEASASKYNHAREWAGQVGPDDVLVVDQTSGDASISGALAHAGSFARMLEAALDEHPRARIWLKVHPDVVAGRKRGHFGALSVAQRQRVHLLAEPIHPAGLLRRVGAVYVVSSQMGFEALLWGRPVRCFGMPFYAGWGLTQDELPAPLRRQPVALSALVQAALLDYPRYLDPETGELCEAERLLAWIGLQRQQRERFAPTLQALGFSGWKRPMLRRFLAGSRLDFISSGSSCRPGGTTVVWGRRELAPGQGPVLRVEDGFLRSVGLGADLVRPVSWVIDSKGLYYDASGPSDLETLLEQGGLSADLLARARRLRQRLLAAGITKYNLGGLPWRRPPGAAQVVLVVGQVESDAAIRHGATGLRTNMALLQAVRALRPHAWLVYKPHPDVVAELRRRGSSEAQATRWCDEVLPHQSMDLLLRQVDEVHVLTSLAGFEALLREVPVVAWGSPFYAGWGLTCDQAPIPARRSRRISLDELTAAALILYPTYLSQVTGHFTTPERALDELLDWQRRHPPAVGPAPVWRQVWRRLLRWWVECRRVRQ